MGGLPAVRTPWKLVLSGFLWFPSMRPSQLAERGVESMLRSEGWRALCLKVSVAGALAVIDTGELNGG